MNKKISLLWTWLLLMGIPFTSMAVKVPSKNEEPKVTQLSESEYQLLLMQHLDSINKVLKYERGEISLTGDVAKIKVPAGFKFLNPEQSKMILEEVWGNPPQEGVLGMLFPEKETPMSDSTWAFVINYEDIGYVKDEDANDIDYNDLLKEMKESVVKESEERVKADYPSIELIGWATKPYYDASHKALHWAKEIKFGDEDEHTLNYGIRVLGRKGVLALNAIGQMSDLSRIEPNIDKIIESTNFTAGNQYSDFDPSLDKVAAWTIGGLVAGKVLAKAGFFAIILKFIKPILAAIAALGAAAWRWLRGSKE